MDRIDPNGLEVRMKINYVPYDIPNGCIRAVLEGYRNVQEVSRETRRIYRFQNIETTNRYVRLNLKGGITVEALPHHLQVFSGTALVVVPGIAPLRMRCKRF